MLKALIKALNNIFLKPLTRRLRRWWRQRNKRRARVVKRDVEMPVVDSDNGKLETVIEEQPKVSADDTGDSQPSSVSIPRHVHFSGP